MKVRVPGKVILFGEHSVVYGKKAIAASIDELAVTAEIKSSTNEKISSIALENFGASYEIANSQLLDKMPSDISLVDCHPQNHILESIYEYATETNIIASVPLICILYIYIFMVVETKKFIPFDLIVSSTIPMGAGLGSSASFSVAIASIFIKYFMNPEIDRHQDLTDRWAFTLEKIIHGNPSGVDNKIVHYGGLLSYVKQRSEVSFQPPEWFHSLKFVLVDTMIPRDTKKMVNNVSIKFQRRPKLLGDSFKKMDEISNKFEQFLKIFKCEKMAFSAISNLFSKNQHHLKVLGVSHPVIEKVITISKKHGHQAKLTGGGGGGFLVVLINPNVDEKDEVYFYKELTLNGFKYYNVKLGGKGLQFEE